MAVDAQHHPVRCDGVALTKEAHEERQKVRVGVGELDGVAVFRPFGPVEHAAGKMQPRRVARELATALLLGQTSGTPANALPARTVEATVDRGIALAKRLGEASAQRDVRGPPADRGGRNTKQRGDLLDRPALVATERARPL